METGYPINLLVRSGGKVTKKLLVVGIGVLVLAFIILLGYFIWFRAYHTCVEWEPKATGHYCSHWHTQPIGKVTTTNCLVWKSCKKCTLWLEDDRVREKPRRPQEACP